MLSAKYPSFNHRRSSFSGRHFPNVEHSVTERHVGVVNVSFRKRLKTHLFSHFFHNFLYKCASVFFLFYRTYFTIFCATLCLNNKAQIPLGSSPHFTSRHDTTRSTWYTEPVHFGCVELVEQHGSTRSSRRARRVECIVSCRDVRWRAKWNLGLSELLCCMPQKRMTSCARRRRSTFVAI